MEVYIYKHCKNNFFSFIYIMKKELNERLERVKHITREEFYEMSQYDLMDLCHGFDLQFDHGENFIGYYKSKHGKLTITLVEEFIGEYSEETGLKFLAFESIGDLTDPDIVTIKYTD